MDFKILGVLDFWSLFKKKLFEYFWEKKNRIFFFIISEKKNRLKSIQGLGIFFRIGGPQSEQVISNGIPEEATGVLCNIKIKN